MPWKKTEYPDRDSWLAARASTIGASEVAAVLGQNKFQCAFTLWHEKKGLVPQFEGNIATRMGLALEPLIAEMYSEQAGHTLVDPGQYTVFSRDDIPGLTCTPDRLVMEGDRIVRVVELKTMGERAAQALQDEVPLSYQIQLQAQMLITGCAHGDIAVLIGNRKFIVIPFERHDRVQTLIRERVAEFLELLEGDTPPPMDAEAPDTADTLRRLHPQDNGETIVAGEREITLLDTYRELQGQITALDEQLKAVRNSLVQAIGDNTFLDAPGIQASYKTQVRKPKLNVPYSAKEVLDSVGIEYKETPGSTYRVLRFKEVE